VRTACLPKQSRYREIYRSEHETWVENVHRPRMAADGAARLRERTALAEHPFATLKRWCGWDHFLVRGLPKVRGEMSLLMLVYNFRRVLSLLGSQRLRCYLAARAQGLDSQAALAALAATLRVILCNCVGLLRLYGAVASRPDPSSGPGDSALKAASHRFHGPKTGEFGIL